MDAYIATILKQVRCFILDMDGTFYLGKQLLPGAVELIELLESRQIPYLFLTNNSSHSRVEYGDKLRSLGVKNLMDGQVLTSGEAAAIYLRNIWPRGRLFVAGTDALESEFHLYGFSLTEDHPDAVILGFDTTLTYEKIWKLCDLVRSGTPYFATHADINCPVENGFMPDTGAMIAMVAASTGRRPDAIIGKPNRPIVAALVEKTGFPIAKLAMVGDRLYTDIALGSTGMTTVLVLSGETHQEDLDGSPYQPDVVVDNLAELRKLLLEI